MPEIRFEPGGVHGWRDPNSADYIVRSTGVVYTMQGATVEITAEAPKMSTADSRPIIGRTADGVDIRHGDRVYPRSWQDEWWHALMLGYGPRAVAPYDRPVPLSECWSTPEAAEAARRAWEDGEDEKDQP